MLTKLINEIEIPETEPFDPKTTFVDGWSPRALHVVRFSPRMDRYGIVNFYKHLLDPAQMTGKVATQTIMQYEIEERPKGCNIEEEKKCIAFNPDELWTAWKHLLFQEPRDRARWYDKSKFSFWVVRCYDGSIRCVGFYEEDRNFWRLSFPSYDCDWLSFQTSGRIFVPKRK